jgi:hypothetical protein
MILKGNGYEIEEQIYVIIKMIIKIDQYMVN